MDAKDVFIGRARKYNHYQETKPTPGRKGVNCIRWRFSSPHTCRGCVGEMYSNKAETCLNYTEDRDAPVD